MVMSHRVATSLLLASLLAACSNQDPPAKGGAPLLTESPPTDLTFLATDGTTFRGNPATITAHPFLDRLTVEFSLRASDGRAMTAWAYLPSTTAGVGNLMVNDGPLKPGHAQVNYTAGQFSGTLSLQFTTATMAGSLNTTGLSGTLSGKAYLNCLKPLGASDPSGAGGGGTTSPTSPGPGSPDGAYVDDTTLETEFCRATSARLGGGSP